MANGRNREKNAPSLSSFGEAKAFSGECLFKITDPNAFRLAALVKYVQALELSIQKEDVEANLDGVLNSLIAEALEKRLKRIAKQRGIKVDELLLILSDATTATEALLGLQESERELKIAEYQEILEHIPLEDRQGRLQLEE